MAKKPTITFVLEIGCEELPPADLPRGEEQLKRLAEELLSEIRLSCRKIQAHSTPRRFIILLSGLQAKQIPKLEFVLGPPMKVAYTEDGKPTEAAIGFAKRQGVSLQECTVSESDRGPYLAYKKTLPALSAEQALAEHLPAYLARLSFPKTMRWNQSGVLFPRPIRWLLALADDKVVPVEFAGLRAGRFTHGHRILAEERRSSVPHARELLPLLKKNGVIVERSKRKATMHAQAKKLLEKVEGALPDYEWLMDQVANTMENPVAVLGAFDPRHLHLPEEVIVSALVGYQRFFPLTSKDGELLPHFIAFHNGRRGASATILRGYQQEITARLNDASFFYEEDRKRGIDAIAEDLSGILFIEGLGTVAEKCARLHTLATRLNEALGLGVSEKAISDGVRLAKADLASLMVQEKEFSSLQGTMGGYYAQDAGYPQRVSRAISEHYMPRASGGELPTTKLGRLLSVCDRLDTLAGCFALGMAPTGSEDPFALRRQALGLLAVLLDTRGENGDLPGADAWRMDMPAAVKLALNNLGDKFPPDADRESIAKDLPAFISRRLRGLLAEHHIRYDLAEAAIGDRLTDPAEACRRAKGLQQISSEKYFDDVAYTFKRAINIVRQGKDLGKKWGDFDVKYFEQREEKELHSKFIEIKEKVKLYIKKSDYANAFRELSYLRPTLINYFDNVLVMEPKQIRYENGQQIPPIPLEKELVTKDERYKLQWHNRLPFMEAISNFFLSLADFTKVVVEGD